MKFGKVAIIGVSHDVVSFCFMETGHPETCLLQVYPYFFGIITSEIPEDLYYAEGVSFTSSLKPIRCTLMMVTF